MFQFHLLLKYFNGKKISSLSENTQEINEWPLVTIQLPIFNEFFVVERLIDNIVNLDYPKNKMQIHVLDDSTDETIKLTNQKVEFYKKRGYNIECITRKERKGYKAGALKAAMSKAQGEFIAIFDADFLPKADFLKSALPYFKDEQIGVVQTRWGHINQKYSLLTELQAFQLNVHFTIEQKGRAAGNYLLQFNGTAGIWRTATINDAGGWEADTLTEDLDLSYRAQLRGWKIAYLEDLLSPAELPVEMQGLKSQQYRWMKGGAETARKLLPQIWRSSLQFSQKIHASMHLLGSSIFLFVFVLGLFSVPLLLLLNPLKIDTDMMWIFMVSLLSILCVYYVANVKASWHELPLWKALIKFVLIFPTFLALSMGLSLHNSLAVIQGYLGRKSAFVRTPKFNIKFLTDTISNNKYRKTKLSMITVLEGILTIYFFCAILLGIYLNVQAFFLLHLLLFFGYATIFYYSISHRRRID